MPDPIVSSRRAFQFAIVLLSLQMLLTYGLERVEYLPSPPRLEALSDSIGDWQRLRDGVIDPEILDMLGADDTLNRYYTDSTSHEISVFIAYYRTQHRIKNAHDPKICLPGSGWVPQISSIIDVPLPDRMISVNYYVINKGSSQRVVLYWYQTHKRSISHGQMLRAYRVLDTIWDNRTDVALVRLITPVYPDGLNSAKQRAVKFIQAAYPLLLVYFPEKARGA